MSLFMSSVGRFVVHHIQRCAGRPFPFRCNAGDFLSTALSALKLVTTRGRRRRVDLPLWERCWIEQKVDFPLGSCVPDPGKMCTCLDPGKRWAKGVPDGLAVSFGPWSLNEQKA